MKRLATANANLDNYFTELPAPAPLVVFPDPTGLQSSSPGKKTGIQHAEPEAYLVQLNSVGPEKTTPHPGRVFSQWTGG